MFAIHIVDGIVTGRPLRQPCADARLSVREAREAGFCIGRRVRIGVVEGVVIGYNIGGGGSFPGHVFPLLVATALGAAKCSVAELTLA